MLRYSHWVTCSSTFGCTLSVTVAQTRDWTTSDLLLWFIHRGWTQKAMNWGLWASYLALVLIPWRVTIRHQLLLCKPFLALFWNRQWSPKLPPSRPTTAGEHTLLPICCPSAGTWLRVVRECVPLCYGAAAWPLRLSSPFLVSQGCVRVFLSSSSHSIPIIAKELFTCFLLGVLGFRSLSL